MIFDKLCNADRYAALHPLFAAAFDYLRFTDFSQIENGRYPLQGEQLIAIVEGAQGRSRENAPLERHRRYIDIQFVLSGKDEMGWRPVSECQQATCNHSEERDIQFFRDVPASWISTPPGAFCIFFPEDAHAPLVSEGAIRKVILKVEAV